MDRLMRSADRKTIEATPTDAVQRGDEQARAPIAEPEPTPKKMRRPADKAMRMPADK